MGLLPCVAVARLPRTERSEGRGVFALVARSRIWRLVVYSRVGKNRDTRRESTGGAGGGPWRQPQIIPL